MSGYIGTGEYYPGKSESTLPYNSYESSAVVYNGKIHILGGYSFLVSTNHYSWNGSSWVEESTLPYEFEDSAVVVYNNKIHILGSARAGERTKHYSWNGSSWVSESTLPYEFAGGSAVVYNNKIHILGGYRYDSSTSPDPRLSHYSWNGTSWVSESTLPGYIFDSAVVWNNKVHIFGGNEANHYSWNGNSWTRESTLPYNFNWSAAVVYNYDIHILGGVGHGTDHYYYNGTAWIQDSMLPYDFEDGSAVVYGSKIHILGGGGSVSDNYTKHYSLEKKIYGDVKKIKRAWFPVKTGYEEEKVIISEEEISTLPYEFYYGSAVVFGGEVNILGGGSGEGNTTSCYKYSDGSWAQVPNLPFSFYSGSAVVYYDRLNILGGYGEYKNHYECRLMNSSYYWTSVSTLPYNFYEGSAVVCNGKIHILGTLSSSNRKKHYRYSNGEWVSVSTLPYEFYYGSAVVYNGEIHILGGFDYSNRTKHYKYSNGEWVFVSTLPYEFVSGSAVVSNNRIHILGGRENDNVNSRKHYSLNGDQWVREPDLPYDFYNGSAIVQNNQIYIFGSYNTLYRRKHYKVSRIDTETTGKLVLTFENKSVKKAWIGDDNGIPRLALSSWGYNEQPNGVLPATPVKHNSIILAVKYTVSQDEEHLLYFNRNSGALDNGISYYFYDGSKGTWKYEGIVKNSKTDDFDNRFLAIEYDGEIYFFGQNYYYRFFDAPNNSILFNLGSLPNELTNSFRGGVVISENKLHLLSGTSHYSWDGTTWIRESTLPTDFVWGSVVSRNTYYIYMCSAGPIYCRDRRDGVWRRIDDPPNSSQYAKMVLDSDDHIHLFGENASTGMGTSNHYSFIGDSTAGSWISREKYPLSPYDDERGLLVLYKDRIHVFGGASNYSSDVSNVAYDENVINDWVFDYVIRPFGSPRWLFFKHKLYIFDSGDTYYAQRDPDYNEFLKVRTNFYGLYNPIIYKDPVGNISDVINTWAEGYHYYTHDGINWMKANNDVIPSDLGDLKVVSNNELHFFRSVINGGSVEQTHYKYSNGVYTLIESSLPIGNSLLRDAFSINNKIYLLGHSDPLGDSNTFIPDLYSWDGVSWNKEADFPVANGYDPSSLTVSDNKLYVVANGSPASMNNAKLYVYNGVSWKECIIEGLTFDSYSYWQMTAIDNKNLLLLYHGKDLYELNIMNYFS